MPCKNKYIIAPSNIWLSSNQLIKKALIILTIVKILYFEKILIDFLLNFYILIIDVIILYIILTT